MRRFPWILTLATAAALVLLIGLAWVILRGSAKLPLGLFFSINAALLFSRSSLNFLISYQSFL